jgi:hypothetical protein
MTISTIQFENISKLYLVATVTTSKNEVCEEMKKNKLRKFLLLVISETVILSISKIARIKID